MSNIKLETFRGIRPKLAPKLLADNEAQVAQNCRLERGRLEPLNGLTSITNVANSDSIYLWNRNVDAWLSWATDVDVVENPVADDDKYRIIYTGDGTPKIKGWVNGAEVTHELSIPIPSAVPTVTPTDRTGFGYNDIAASFLQYVFTYTIKYHLIDSQGNVTAMEKTITPNPLWGSATFPTRDEETGAWNIKSVFTGFTPEAFYGSGIAVIDGFWILPGSYFLWNYQGKVYKDSDTITVSDANGQYCTAQVLMSTTVPVPEIEGSQRNVVILPSFECSVALSPTFTQGPTSTEDPVYVVTNVQQWGDGLPEEEGPPTDPSPVVEWLPGQKVVISGLGVGGDANTIKQRIYRSVAGTTVDTYYFVGEVDYGTTSFTDTQTDALVVANGEMPLFENPPDDLQGIVMMSDFAAAFHNKEICFSGVNLVHTWPSEYRLVVEYNIVGLAAEGSNLVVMTEGETYICYGDSPDNMSLSKISGTYPCLAKKSICVAGNNVLYASPDGYMAVSGGTATLLTKDHYQKDQWDALTPSNMVAGFFDGTVLVSYATGSLIFDLRQGLEITTSDLVITSMFYEIKTDTLYVILNSVPTIYSWNTDTANPLMATWRTKAWRGMKQVSWTSARVVQSGYTNTQILFYAENVLVNTQTVTSIDGFRVAMMQPQRAWSFAVKTYNPVDWLCVATSMLELQK